MIVRNGKLKKVDDFSLPSHVTISKKVKVITQGAFSYCYGLKSITIPSSVEIIEDYAFEGCENLETVNFSSGLVKIGDSAFSRCKKLKKINIPMGVTHIEAFTFKDCENLSEVTLPDTLVSLGEWAFSYSGIEKIIIPDSVTKIESNCFFNCEMLKEVKLSSNMTVINPYLFEGCKNLSYIEIPCSVKVIKEESFSRCSSLREIKFSNGLESIETSAFYSCRELKSITFPRSLEFLGTYAFSECENLESVYIPNNIKRINEEGFSKCTSLTNVILEDGIERIGPFAFYKSGLKMIEIPNSVKTIGDCAFKSCDKLKYVKLSNNLKTISYKLFEECTRLRRIEIPEGIKTIEGRAFENCFSLKTIALPRSLEVIKFDAFFNSIPRKWTIYSDTVLEGANETKTKIISLDVINSRTNEVKKICIPSNKIVSRCKEGMLFEIFNTFMFFDSENKWVKVNKSTFSMFDETINFKKNYIKLYEWNKIGKFIPDTIVSILPNIKIKDMRNYYLNNNMKRWKDLVEIISPNIPHNVLDVELDSFFKLSYALGLFSSRGKDSQKAYEFLKNILIEDIENYDYEYHVLFGEMETNKYGYNEEFAKLVYKNYSGGDFFTNDEGVTYFARIYNNFSKIKEVYPNKKINTNRNVDLLTIPMCINVVNFTEYEDVDEGNEEFASNLGKYGYSQEDFDNAQMLFERGKSIPEEEITLVIEKDDENNLITYELLEKDNPLGVILGDITNCCQTLNGVGSECVEYGLSKRNSKFMVFRLNGTIMGQSWVWYDEDNKRICLDNIEVPKAILSKEMKKEKYKQAFLLCLKRSVKGFIEGMDKKGLVVDSITIGEGYNDVSGLLKTYKLLKDQPTPSDYDGYTDADNQYLIYSRN